MPLVIYVSSLCAFALGFTEFVTIGLISTVAADFHINVARMGAAVTVYAGGVVLGAPILTALTARWSRKSVILCTMLAFTVANVAVGFSQNLSMLLAARLIAGLAHRVFFFVVANVASRLVPPERAGSALSLVFGGVTVAMALAVPIGTWLGSMVAWQALFFATALCGIAASAGISALMPSDHRNGKDRHSTALDDLRALLDHRLLAGASIPMLSFAGSFML